MSTVPTEPILASYNEDFLESNEGRPLRILAEYIQPLRAFQREHIHDTIVFFGSVRLHEDGRLGRYYKETQEPGPSGDRMVAFAALRGTALHRSYVQEAAMESWKPQTGGN